MVNAFLETTEWKDSTPNHIYFIDGYKITAYIKKGSNKIETFSKPMNFDKRGRTFVKLTAKQLKMVTG